MSETEAIDYDGLAALLAGTRKSRGANLRAVAALTKISASTLSRIERREVEADFATVKALMHWIGVPLDRVVRVRSEDQPAIKAGRSGERRSLLESVEVQFRASPDLPHDVAEALIKIMRTAYAALTKQSDEAARKGR